MNTSSLVESRTIVNHTRASVRFQNGRTFLSQHVPLDDHTRCHQLLVRCFKDGTFVETNCFRIGLRRGAYQFRNTGPQCTTQTHGTRLTTRIHEILRICRLATHHRKGLQFLLCKLNCHHFTMQCRIIQWYHTINTNRKEFAFCSFTFKDGTSEWSTCIVLNVTCGKFNGNFHSFFVRGEVDIFQRFFVLDGPCWQGDSDFGVVVLVGVVGFRLFFTLRLVEMVVVVVTSCVYRCDDGK
mmetsp:Transcript_22954/g.65035  ORF Transcript_22954/g.65035 Transcript_22954/m.65035 type:complete len:239 (+) Transcript_22954:171-887(+)